MSSFGTTLGLDLGVASIGWALVDEDELTVLRAGARVFDAPMDVAMFEKGEPGGSHSAARRKSRGQRRMTRRRQARHRNLYLALQAAGFLPFAGPKAEDRGTALEALDARLRQKWLPLMQSDPNPVPAPDQVLCYYMRSQAAIAQVEADELGRALYHLGQRRGFKSNRREGRGSLTAGEAKKQDTEKSDLKTRISSLASHLDEAGLTLGQHLSRIDPHQQALRNRKRPDIAPIGTGRAMFQTEFERIWETQAPHHPALTETLKARLERMLFKQRDISAGKPGTCSFERDPPLPRAPKSSLLAQHFRVVQAVNNLRIERGLDLPIDPSVWAHKKRMLIERLTTIITQGKGKKRTSERYGMTFPEVKEFLKLGKRVKLNLDDEDADTYLRGNRTNAIMTRAFGASVWKDLPELERRRVVRRWMSESSPEKLLRVAKQQWGLSADAAEQVVSLEPEDGYTSLSHVAMLKLLPHMESGCTYSEAVEKVYRNLLSGGEEHDLLPPVDEHKQLPRIPNPVVKRALSELRSVVNTLIREEGRKPDRIRIELARDLKRNAEQRERLQENMRVNARERAIAKKLVEDLGKKPTDDAITKVRLYRRCKDCLYCGRSLGCLSDLFSDGATVEMEHVLPRRCADNSFSNLVLAHRACNVRKGDRTPRQAWDTGESGDTNSEWESMLARVQHLGDKGLEDRFCIKSEDELRAFTHRHLSDTRYVSKLASEYMEALYGGRDARVPWEDRNERRVFSSSGAVTAELRKRWGLNNLLNGTSGVKNNGPKSRDDHRHHAVDAIVIALTSSKVLQRVSLDLTKHDRSDGYLGPKFLSPPWPTHGDLRERVTAFRNEIKELVQQIKVSHRVNHRLSGQLHDQNELGREKRSPDGVFRHKRKAVEDLSEKDIPWIADEAVKAAVREKFEELGNLELCAKHSDWPVLKKSGRTTWPIRKVRLKTTDSARAIGNGRNPRFVHENNNHHFVIWRHTDSSAQERWYTDGPVSRLDVAKALAQAKRQKLKQPFPIIPETNGPGTKRVMSLMKGDCVEMLDPVNDRRDIYKLVSLSDGDYAFQRHSVSMPSAKALGLTTGRLRQQMQESGDRVRVRADLDKLRLLGCRKVQVSPTGRVSYARD